MSEKRVPTSAQVGIQVPKATEWTERQTADNAVAVAIHAGEAGKRHYVTYIAAGYEEAVTQGTVRIQVDSGATIIFEVKIQDAGHFAFPFPIECPEGSDVRVFVNASGTAGNIGAASIGGYTLDA